VSGQTQSRDAAEAAVEARGPFHFHRNHPDDIIYIWSSDKAAIAFTGVIATPVQTGRTNEENLANAAMIVRALNALRAAPQSAPPSDAFKAKLYAVLSKHLPQDMIDGIWQEVEEGCLQPGGV
jgi:hypothetical protein